MAALPVFPTDEQIEQLQTSVNLINDGMTLGELRTVLRNLVIAQKQPVSMVFAEPEENSGEVVTGNVKLTHPQWVKIRLPLTKGQSC